MVSAKYNKKFSISAGLYKPLEVDRAPTPKENLNQAQENNIPV